MIYLKYLLAVLLVLAESIFQYKYFLGFLRLKGGLSAQMT